MAVDRFCEVAQIPILMANVVAFSYTPYVCSVLGIVAGGSTSNVVSVLV